MVPDATLLLGGYALAHAAWSLSDLEHGELLCPLAFVEQNDQRELLRFESDTQEEAISNAKEYLESACVEADAWAFAREGLIREPGRAVDVISVDFFGRGMPRPATLVQRYVPFAQQGQFKLSGVPDVVINGIRLEAMTAHRFLQSARQGILEHRPVAELWVRWDGW